jgi:hypothetical protein
MILENVKQNLYGEKVPVTDEVIHKQNVCFAWLGVKF